MENVQQERVLAYTISTPLDQRLLTEVTGGANPGPSASARVVITGDYTAPDVVVEL